MQKVMHDNSEGSNNLVWFTITSMAGLIKYFAGVRYDVQILQINWLTVFSHVWEGVLVAFSCGIVGVIGKEIGKIIVVKMKKYFNDKTK